MLLVAGGRRRAAHRCVLTQRASSCLLCFILTFPQVICRKWHELDAASVMISSFPKSTSFTLFLPKNQMHQCVMIKKEPQLSALAHLLLHSFLSSSHMSHMQCGWSPCRRRRRRRRRRRGRRRRRATAVAFLGPQAAAAAISSRTTWLRLRLSQHAAGLRCYSHPKICRSSTKLENNFLCRRATLSPSFSSSFLDLFDSTCPGYQYPR